MPRNKKSSFEREVGLDLRYQSSLMQKFINTVMRHGKKNTACRIVYDAMDILEKRAGSAEKAYELFEKAVFEVKPAVEVKSRRVGGGVYQVPVEVRPARSLAITFRWIIASAKKRSDKTMGQRIARELLDATEGQGGAFKKKLDTHRMAEANRAFSHYAW